MVAGSSRRSVMCCEQLMRSGTLVKNPCRNCLPHCSGKFSILASSCVCRLGIYLPFLASQTKDSFPSLLVLKTVDKPFGHIACKIEALHAIRTLHWPFWEACKIATIFAMSHFLNPDHPRSVQAKLHAYSVAENAYYFVMSASFRSSSIFTRFRLLFCLEQVASF